ncbi:GIY-YIG nuclease family protein [Alcanivorax sp.]|uniref:GIY-YIG nuclease family protein n=1 Tax=Alcanivorax sp. TaxID=1872427 RepID=UPI0032D9242D
MQQWWVYMLECADRSLYTGISTEPARRVHEHNTSPKGARYTRARRPVRPVLLLPGGDRGSASQLEARIKRLSRRDKQYLLAALMAEKRQRPLSVWIESLTE